MEARALQHRWAIVLAGGEGERLRPFIVRWLGQHRPKQYCTFTGSRSMLQHTLDRMRGLILDSHLLTVIGKEHSRFLSHHPPLPGRILEQPENLDTGPGVFFPLSYILAEDPAAVVAILPSDHFIFPEKRFRNHLLEAFRLAEWLKDRIVLLGMKPDSPEPDYGWIQAGGCVDCELAPHLKRVRSFHEKPGLSRSRFLFRHGGLWNTMVMVVQARTLWRLGRRLLLDLVRHFERLRLGLWAIRNGWLDRRQEGRLLAEAYLGLKRANLSRHLLQSVPGISVVLTMTDLEWSDWGRASRILETLKRHGRPPAFPVPAEGGGGRKRRSSAWNRR